MSFPSANVQQSFETSKQSGERLSLREDTYRRQLAEWKKRNGLPKDAVRPAVPIREQGESAAHFVARVNRYRVEEALWRTVPRYEGNLVTGAKAQAEFNRELQRRSVLARIAVQDGMLAIRKA